MKFSKFLKSATASTLITLSLLAGLQPAGAEETQGQVAEVTAQGTVLEAADKMEYAQQDINLTNRVVVTFKEPADPATLESYGWKFKETVRGVNISYIEVLSDTEIAVAFDQVADVTDMENAARVMSRYVYVQSAAPDRMAVTERNNAYHRAVDPLLRHQWYLNTIGARQAWAKGYTGYGVKIAIIDSGYSRNNDTLNYWIGGKDYITDSRVANDGDGADANPYDSAGSKHGTMVHQFAAAGVNRSGAVGVAPDARTTHYRVAGARGVTYSSWVKKAFHDAVNSDARVINLSLGSSGTAKCNDFLDAKDLQKAKTQKKIVVVAAGNKGKSAHNTAPANCDNVITVGALTRSGNRASFSNYGPQINLWAPGAALNMQKDGRHYLMSGTSYATPMVSGASAILLEKNPTLNQDQILQVLRQTATWTPQGPQININKALDRV